MLRHSFTDRSLEKGYTLRNHFLNLKTFSANSRDVTLRSLQSRAIVKRAQHPIAIDYSSPSLVIPHYSRARPETLSRCRPLRISTRTLSCWCGISADERDLCVGLIIVTQTHTPAHAAMDLPHSLRMSSKLEDSL